MNKMDIEFYKLEYGTVFESWTGLEWIKVSDDSATPTDSEEEFPFEPNEIVTV